MQGPLELGNFARIQGKTSCNGVLFGIRCPPVKKASAQRLVVLEGHCAGPKVCPLSRVRAGTVVCIKQLSTGPELTERLRELGLVEDQEIKLLAKEPGFICQVCNARLGLSRKLADSILVEAVPAATP